MADKNLAAPRFPARAITYSTAKRLLLRNMLENVDMPTCFIGPPGVGKTALVDEVCKQLKANLCVIPLSCYDASELKGIPRVVPLEELRAKYPKRVTTDGSGFVTYYAHNFEFPATDDPNLWVFFFDEFNTVPPSTQVPIFQATQKRCITGSYQFPAQNRIILAGNRPKDSEAVQPIPSPIISRVNLHEIKMDTREWLDWGKDIHNGIRSFISANPDRLCYFTEEMVRNVEPYATPRTWEYASNILRAYQPEDLAKMEQKDDIWGDLSAHLRGTIGDNNVTFRDSNQKTLLQYIKEAAVDLIHADVSPLSKIRRMMQTVEDNPAHREAKTQGMRILKLLPEIDPIKAATFVKRLSETKVNGVSLASTILKEQPALAKELSNIPGLKENLSQLK